MSKEQTWVYIGRTTKPIEGWPIPGTIVAATVDLLDAKKKVAADVVEFIKDGLAVERVPVEWIRKHFGTADLYQREGE